MKVEIDAGGLADAVRENKRELSRDLARHWFESSQRLLLDRAEEYSSFGGTADQAEVHSVVQSGYPPTWEDGAWRFGFAHLAAPFFEYGTEPHVIEPTGDTQYLKFPWPDAPDNIVERFEDQWDDPSHWLQRPEVLLKKVNHPGTPELRFVRDARQVAAREVGL